MAATYKALAMRRLRIYDNSWFDVTWHSIACVCKVCLRLDYYACVTPMWLWGLEARSAYFDKEEAAV